MASPALLRRVLALPPSLRRNIWSSSKPELYDIVCIGGGPAGLSLVSALKSHPATQSLKVALLDSQDLTSKRLVQDAKTYSNRCSSLTPSSVRFMKEIGVWGKVKMPRTQDYHTMDVWDGVSGSMIHFDGLDAQSGPGLLDSLAELVPGNSFQAIRRKHEMEDSAGVVATMCENTNLTAALLQHMGELSSSSSITLMDNTKVDSITLGPEPENETSLDLSQWPIVNTPTTSLATRLLVGADGANSPVRQFADISSHGWDYNQHGVVATISLDQTYPPESIRTAYQRFLPTGPIALLPLPDNKASLVWSTTPQIAAKLKSLAAEDFIAAVNAAFRLLPVDIEFMLSPSSDTNSAPTSEYAWRLPNINPASTGLPGHFPTITALQPGTVASFPLRMRHASTYTGHRIALLGDAAHTIHPLAGQGLNLGLADAQALATQIVHGVEHGMDIGSSWCLEGYNAERWAKNNAVMGVVDKLQKLYSVGSGPVVWGRSLGLGIVERIGRVKGMVMGIAR